jgi:anti-anti-sigma factor
MEIAEYLIDDVLVLEPIGYIDSTNASALMSALTEAVKTRKCSLVIDFQKIKYISSAGLRSLLIVGEEIEAIQKKLVFCGMAADVRRVLSISKFDELFPICASREEAARVAQQ